MIVLKWLLGLAALGYFGALVTLYLTQRTILYPVPTTLRTAPGAAGLPQAEEHVLTTSDGERVIVWHVAARPGHHVVLYFHGNGDALAYLVGRFRAITADGTGLLALAYRGYAGSSGSPSEKGLLADAEAAYAFAAALYEPRRLVPWGHSLGTGPAVATAARHPVGGLILEAPYTSIADVGAAAFPFFPVRYLVRDRFPSDEWIAGVTAPVLVMHGARDQTIPLPFGERLFALAHEPKQFVRFDQGGHNDLGNFGAHEAARQFIDALKD